MDKVLILINLNKLWHINNADEKFEGIDSLFKEKILKYKQNEIGKPSLIKYSSLQDGDIFFILDTVTSEEFKNYCDSRNKEKDMIYVLHHTSGLRDFPQAEWIKTKLGMHTTEPEDFYFTVFEILTDETKSDKVQQIIELVFKSKLEVALEFLLRCLDKKPESYEKLKKVGIKINTLPELVGNPPEDGYISSLRELRDELIKQIS